jgi:plasmid maintenance system killer protein
MAAQRRPMVAGYASLAKIARHRHIPGLRFHGLKGEDKGRYSDWASGNWRITFGWDEPEASRFSIRGTV